MAFTREQTQQVIGGMGNAHLADTIANPFFDADARHYGVEILIDRKAPQPLLDRFAVIVKSITDGRVSAAVAKAEEEAQAAVAKRAEWIQAAQESEARYEAGKTKAAEADQHASD